MQEKTIDLNTVSDRELAFSKMAIKAFIGISPDERILTSDESDLLGQFTAALFRPESQKSAALCEVDLMQLGLLDKKKQFVEAQWLKAGEFIRQYRIDHNGHFPSHYDLLFALRGIQAGSVGESSTSVTYAPVPLDSQKKAQVQQARKIRKRKQQAKKRTQKRNRKK